MPYLNPRPSVVLGGGPGINQALPVEAGEVGVPLLQAEERPVGGGGRYLLVGDDPALHAERPGALWVKRESQTVNKLCDMIMDFSFSFSFFCKARRNESCDADDFVHVSFFFPLGVDTVPDLSLSTVPQTCT